MPVYTTPEEAELAFYEAFETANLADMARVWAESDDITCVHPMGNCLKGRALVMSGWREVFSSGTRLAFELTPIQQNINRDIAIHTLYENISLVGSNRPSTSMIATNIYQLINGSWQIILHHSSLMSVENDIDLDMYDEDDDEDTDFIEDTGLSALPKRVVH
ncbi:YybH family protein [Beggiatoa leptomitoformis]|uniref:DUF4440 domain-containing protein n=1 Tax=Beggiatoa leptomitoformis TaxID=288004 RepID=A0A2N9YG77_9GAMM|nr:nuclear transport factor 2 family protein [Beggiatoa leptomitoformis]AUI69389.1 DUF4440 domain-containing protein [Beggiatoa leptomitoformis]QGX03718.1 DUF4440 domain-containing protein [Beggiatoa leptomitoformis]